MNNNRRNFLKLTSIFGAGILSSGFFKPSTAAGNEHSLANVNHRNPGSQRFNMSGYAAPAIDTVRVGLIGLGQRIPAHLRALAKLNGVAINALCDVVPDKVAKAQKLIEGSGNKPVLYQSGNSEEWKKLCDRKDIDLVYISTPWHLHASMAVYAMEHGKHVAIEVPAAVTTEECWQLVETSERTRKHCMMLENCCYDFFELLTLNMARQGFFGELIHAEGAYIHDLLDLNFDKNGYWDMWRLKENGSRNGSLYPTHGVGPVCQLLNINRGDKMDYLVSMSGDDFSMQARAKELAASDKFYQPYVGLDYRGNMNTTTIRTSKGRTILIQHDVSSPNVYSRIHKISGTKGSALKYPLPGRISTSHKGWLGEEEIKALESKYQPPIVTKIGEMARKIGGHGGMDTLMNWRLIDCLRNGMALDQDVYDAALWSVIAPLSEKSIATRSNSVDIPDFTRGAWEKNAPVDINLENGSSTTFKG